MVKYLQCFFKYVCCLNYLFNSRGMYDFILQVKNHFEAKEDNHMSKNGIVDPTTRYPSPPLYLSYRIYE